MTKKSRVEAESMKVGFAFLVALSLSAPGPVAAMDKAKHDDVKALTKELGEVEDMWRGFDASLHQSIDGLRKQRPNIPGKFWDDVIEDARQEVAGSLPEIEESIIAIYDANYTDEEIKQLLAFYRSPIGRKVVVQTPRIEEQSKAFGEVFGKRIGERVREHIRERGKQQGYEL
jgi:uncharacterized protein